MIGNNVRAIVNIGLSNTYCYPSSNIGVFYICPIVSTTLRTLGTAGVPTKEHEKGENGEKRHSNEKKRTRVKQNILPTLLPN